MKAVESLGFLRVVVQVKPMQLVTSCRIQTHSGQKTLHLYADWMVMDDVLGCGTAPEVTFLNP